MGCQRWLAAEAWFWVEGGCNVPLCFTQVLLPPPSSHPQLSSRGPAFPTELRAMVIPPLKLTLKRTKLNGHLPGWMAWSTGEGRDLSGLFPLVLPAARLR